MYHDVKAVVLAAGKGTRLQTDGVDLPKVLRLANGKPLLRHVVTALDFLTKDNIILVLGWKKEMVAEQFPEYPVAEQNEQLGTGHAVQCAAPLLQQFNGHVLICCGDAPLMKKKTFRSLIDLHIKEGNACTMLSAHLADAGSYGRVMRDKTDAFSHIVEAKDCTPEQLDVTEVNTGTYVFRCNDLLACLDRLRCDNAQGEYYLTDVPALIQENGGRVGLCDTCSGEEMLGVNTVEQLNEVEQILRMEEDYAGK